MGWQTSAPSLPSGSSYGTKQTVTLTANNFKLSGEISIARLDTNQVSVKVAAWTSQNGSSPYYPPGYYYFRAGATNYTAPGWTSGLTRYWVGTLNSGSSLTIFVGYSSDGQTAGGGLQYKDVTGPAYVTKYTIWYNGNTADSGSTTAQTKTYGTPITLQQNGYTKTGYNFLNWNTRADGSGTTYAAGGTFSNNYDVTMYAQWQLKTYTISYNGNGSDGGSTASQTKDFGQALTLSSNGFTRTGYTFLYWNTAADGSGTTYAAGASFTDNENRTLYAIWKKSNIPVYINVGGTIKQVEKAYVNAGGQVKECTVYYNDNGTIRTLI